MRIGCVDHCGHAGLAPMGLLCLGDVRPFQMVLCVLRRSLPAVSVALAAVAYSLYA